ncbi:lamin tail domain-containing protein [Halococcoides cellulosivorans]|uniref:Endonuclease n=1 Tax=Halococcoides cellulosivorans TaxID=1679096 RepID=A0A2R4WZB1_9EURY|nr:lamin tail domain-containing protein [Halococcoides cellulosivorans]AWB26882.1 endonuclease [Halococcoides cellulosivorans]
MKRTLALLAIVVLAGCTVSVSPGETPTAQPTIPSDRTTVTVERVVDGDTLEVTYADGTPDTLRLLGVDTPEVHVGVDPAEFPGVPDDRAGRAWLSSWGTNATQYVESRVANRRVEIVVGGDRRGSYGRLLVYVYVDDAMLNRELLREGYARLYDSEFEYRDGFADLEREARDAGVGVWGFEESTTPLQVTEIHADAAGDDRENLNDEYVVLANAGNETLDLSGWELSDESGKTYVFPDGVVLDPGDSVTLFTGSGVDSEGERYWGRDSPVWNNAGDTVIVETSDGAIAAAELY